MSKLEPRYFFISATAGDGFATFDDLKAHMRKMDLVPSEFVAVVGHASDLVEEVLLRPRIPLDGASTAPQPKREPVDNTEVNAKVLAYLRSNPDTRRFKDIEAATGLTGAQLTDAKKALVKAGEVNDEGKGAMSAKVHAEQGT